MMDKQILLDVITCVDLDLKARQQAQGAESDTQKEMEVARELLATLRTGVVREEQPIFLDDTWPLSTLALVRPAIDSLEAQGITVLYAAITCAAREKRTRLAEFFPLFPERVPDEASPLSHAL